MKNQSVLNVLYQSDENYAIFMGVSILSLLINNKDADEINIFIIENDISIKNKIEKMVKKYNRNVIFINADIILKSPKVCDIPKYVGMRKNSKSFMKMFLDDILPESIDRIIYIDCDTLVVGNISELMTINMEEFPLGMALDSLVLKAKPSIGLKTNEPYYNSGVIVFNLHMWKEKECSSRVVNHLSHIRTYGTVDQDVLNIEFKSEIKRLSMNYNIQPAHLVYSNKIYFSCFKHPKDSYYSCSEINAALADKKIIHFFRYLGESPWNKNNYHPARELFDKYLYMSPWSDYEKKKSNRGTVFKIEKLLYLLLPKKLFFSLFTSIHERMVINSNSTKTS